MDTVCFEFVDCSNHQFSTNHWFEKLKFKLNSFCTSEKSFVSRVFTSSHDNEIKQWKVFCDPKTRKFQELYCVGTLGKCAVYSNLLFNEQTNDLLFFTTHDVLQWNATNKYINSQYCSLNNISKIRWYFDKKKQTQYLIVRYFPNQCKIINYKSKTTRTFDAPEERDFIVDEFSNQLIFFGFTHRIVFWCLKTLKSLGTLPIQYCITSVCLIENKYVAIGSMQSQFSIWEKDTGNCVCTIETKHNDGAICGLLYSSKQHYLFLRDNSHVIKVWRILFSNEKVRTVLAFEIKTCYNSMVTELKFLDFEERLIVIGDYNGNLMVFDLNTRRFVWKRMKANNLCIESMVTAT